MKVRLYEREAALGAIQRVLAAAFAGRGGTVFVVAPAGLGKTSVLQAAVAEARDRFDVRIADGDAVEAALPYGVITQVLRDEDKQAAPGGVGELPAATLFYATLRRINQAAATQPLLLALDDLHWADPDSLTFLHMLCRRAGGCRWRWWPRYGRGPIPRYAPPSSLPRTAWPTSSGLAR